MGFVFSCEDFRWMNLSQPATQSTLTLEPERPLAETPVAISHQASVPASSMSVATSVAQSESVPQNDGVAAEATSASDSHWLIEVAHMGETPTESLAIPSAATHCPQLLRTEPATGSSSTAGLCRDNLCEVPSHPSLWPSQHVLSLQEQVRDALRAKLPMPAICPFPTLLAEVCEHFHISLVDLQVLLMPQWGLGRVTPFRSKAALFRFLGRKTEAGRLGEVRNLSMRGQDRLFDASKCVVRTVRWVELLDGTVLARLLTDGYPAVTRNWASFPTMSAALRSIRKVPWTPRLHWAFPEEYRKRVQFLLCLGHRLNLGSPWREVVLPFLASLAPDELHASLAQSPGQRLFYHSTACKEWIPCTVTLVDVASGSIMVDVRPGIWMSPSVQAERLLAHCPQSAAIQAA
mmetsp:Transcript_100229/g.198784  ORF Transcript_100229/g.198784 Transcript_100229/m.198784 type:complete len:405 (+) Transcript_100229:87-1301(+)